MLRELTALEKVRRHVHDVYYRWRLYQVGVANAYGKDEPTAKVYERGIVELENILTYIADLQYQDYQSDATSVGSQS